MFYKKLSTSSISSINQTHPLGRAKSSDNLLNFDRRSNISRKSTSSEIKEGIFDDAAQFRVRQASKFFAKKETQKPYIPKKPKHFEEKLSKRRQSVEDVLSSQGRQSVGSFSSVSRSYIANDAQSHRREEKEAPTSHNTKSREEINREKILEKIESIEKELSNLKELVLGK